MPGNSILNRFKRHATKETVKKEKEANDNLYIVWIFIKFFAIVMPFFLFFVFIIASVEGIFNGTPWAEHVLLRIKEFAAIIITVISLFLSLAILFLLSNRALIFVRNINEKRGKRFTKNERPLLFNEIQKELGDGEMYFSLFYIGYGFTSLVNYLLLAFQVKWIVGFITISNSIFILLFYVSVIIRHRHSSKNIFYQVRSVILPYMVLLFPLLILASLTFFSANWLIIEISNWFKIPLDFLSSLQLNSMPSFAESLNIFVTCIFWSFGICLSIVWILPILIKKDLKAILVIVITIASPFIADFVLGKLENSYDNISSLVKIPIPVIALIIILLFDKIYGAFSDKFRDTVQCTSCMNDIPRKDNYCARCGALRPDLSEQEINNTQE